MAILLNIIDFYDRINIIIQIKITIIGGHMAKQVKSKKRVAEHGEVFTNERKVKAMCDLVADELLSICRGAWKEISVLWTCISDAIAKIRFW